MPRETVAIRRRTMKRLTSEVFAETADARVRRIECKGNPDQSEECQWHRNDRVPCEPLSMPSQREPQVQVDLSLIHISEPTRLGMISYAVFCLKKKKKII